jgi:hypothetical protein
LAVDTVGRVTGTLDDRPPTSEWLLTPWSECFQRTQVQIR